MACLAGIFEGVNFQSFNGILAGLMVLAGGLAGCAGPVPPGSAQILNEAGAAYEQGNDQAVITLTDKFLSLHPKSQEAGEAHYLRGLVHLRQDEDDAAQADLRRAVELTGRSDLAGRAEFALGLLAEGREDWPSAQNEYELSAGRLALGDPMLAEVLYRLGALYQRLGQWSQADQRFDRLAYLFTETPQATEAIQRVRANAWTIQTGMFSSRLQAERQADELRQAGSEAEITPALQDGLTFLVQVGRYGDYAQAMADLPKIRQHYPHATITLRR